MYEDVSVTAGREWVRDIRSREGALFWTSVVAILVDVLLATAAAVGWMDAGVAATVAASWTGGLTALGALIRGDVYAEASVDRIAVEAYQRGQEHAGG